jgi:hypothetical protein
MDNPDLVAIRQKPFVLLLDRIYPGKYTDRSAPVRLKKKDLLLVEIVEWTKSSGTLMSQLQRYSEVGDVILVLPLDTRKIKFVGTQVFNLYAPTHGGILSHR